MVSWPIPTSFNIVDAQSELREDWWRPPRNISSTVADTRCRPIFSSNQAMNSKFAALAVLYSF